MGKGEGKVAYLPNVFYSREISVLNLLFGREGGKGTELGPEYYLFLQPYAGG